MKLLILLLLVVLVVLAVWAVATWAAQRGRAAAARWELEERSDGEALVVRAVHPGEAPLVVGSVPFASPDFDSRIEEVRSEGRYKLAALNSGRRRLE